MRKLTMLGKLTIVGVMDNSDDNDNLEEDSMLNTDEFPLLAAARTSVLVSVLTSLGGSCGDPRLYLTLRLITQ